MKWVEAAHRVLMDAERPLHSFEIAERAEKRGLVSTRGQTPEHSVQAAVWKHINKIGNKLGFVMIGEGRTDRRYWLKSKRRRKD